MPRRKTCGGAMAPTPYVGGRINPKWVKYHAAQGKGLNEIIGMLPGLISSGKDLVTTGMQFYGRNKSTIDPIVSSVKSIFNRLFRRRGQATRASGMPRRIGGGLMQSSGGSVSIRPSPNAMRINRRNYESRPAQNLTKNKRGGSIKSKFGKVLAVPYMGGEIMRGPIA
jgi:hypothetical protein